MSRHTLRIALAGLSIAGMTSVASAVPLLQLDFDAADGHTADAAPATTTAAVEGGVTTRFTTPMRASGTNYTSLVRDASATGTFYEGFGDFGGAGNDGNVLVLSDTNSNTTGESSANFRFYGNANDAETSNTVIGFDLLVDSAANRFNFILADGNGTRLGILAFGQHANMEFLTYNNGTFATIVNTGIAYETGVAHHWTLTLDYDAGKMILKRDDLATTASVDFTNTLALERLDLSPNGNFVGDVALDDLSIGPVPEPASLALLGLGGLAMLRRRGR